MSGAPYAIGNPRWPADLRRRTFSSRERYRHARIGLPLALVSKLSTAARRLLIGRPFRSDRLSHTLLPKRIALPVFASDAMSSIAYAPEEIFLVLSVAGLAAYSMAPLNRPGGRRGSARGGV
ncbi:putative integral membrane alanine and valine and leucine rich protein [Mycobacterium tuberculosis]|nr:putative integral membrane alanine and valine and leucine rich protein [Mycobacterium tuberculosis]